MLIYTINNLTYVAEHYIQCIARYDGYKYQNSPDVTEYSVVHIVRGTKVSHSQLQISLLSINLPQIRRKKTVALASAVMLVLTQSWLNFCQQTTFKFIVL